MGHFNKKVILKYLYDQLTGNFMGFLIGMSATSLVSQFFETRGLRNLWGITSKKTIVDKDTFANLEWVISIFIGFIVFEVFTKVLREKIKKSFPALKTKAFRFIIVNDLKNKAVRLMSFFNERRLGLFSSFYGSVKTTFAKYSKR